MSSPADGSSAGGRAADQPLISGHDDTWLGAVLPGAAAALGVPTGLPAVPLPSARKICVVLLDGMGERQLTESAGHAKFLSQAPRSVLTVGTPSTTATSMGSFGTGLPTGRHGLAGYLVLDPDRGELLNELKWDPATDPVVWQPHPTVFELLAAEGKRSLAIGNPEFAGSGLTRAAHRGSEFVGARRLHRRVETAAAALADPAGPDLVYLYWGEIDAAGHWRGWNSPQWRRALRHTDRELARLARRMPGDCLLVVTADHGMVDAAAHDRIDLAERSRPEIAMVGGEPRFAQLYCHPGAAEQVAAEVAAEVGDKAWVRTREQAEQQGWFGPVEPRVRGRIGDVVVAAKGLFTLVDSQWMSASECGLIGYHGSLTADEQQVPLIVVQ